MDADLLTMLKVDLGITVKAYDTRLETYLDAAKAEITREGITLDDAIGDCQLVVLYASWMWRKRDTGESMPRMLRYRLNNRLFSQKMKEGAEDDG